MEQQQRRCPLDVLIVEDSEDDAILTMDALRAGGYEPSWKRVETAGEMTRALSQTIWHLIVADYRLPKFSALQAFEIYRQFGLDIPFIIVSGAMGEEIAVAAMRAGVHDYMTKGNLARLAPAVRRELREAESRRERKFAEDSLQVAHEELATIHANAPVVLLLVDEDLCVEKANDLAARLSGRQASDIEGRRPGHAIGCLNALADPRGCGHGPSCGECKVRRAVLDTVFNGTRNAGVEAWVPLSIGGQKEARCLLISTAPMQSGERRKALICAQDITELKRAGAVLARQNVTLRQQAELINLSHDAIITTAPDHVITGWNGGATEMYGWTEVEAVGKLSHLLLENTSIPISEIDRVLYREGRCEGELVHVRHDGQKLVVDSRQVLVRDETGAPAAILEINRDITGRKQSELHILDLNRDLDRRLEELRRANDSLRQFAYAAAHDLQEPLRNVANSLGLLNFISLGPPEGEATRVVHEAIENAQRMLQMVKDLLAYAQIEDLQDQSSEPVDANEILTWVLKNLSLNISESRARITYGSLPMVCMASTHLIQLLQNLIANALKYRKREQIPTIEISAVRRGAEWLFAIADNGIGFDPSYADRIFGVFKRLHQRHEYPGTGIGLALCSRIVARYGGRIWAEGQPGVGATFWFTLPGYANGSSGASITARFQKGGSLQRSASAFDIDP